jgi:competence protein ComEA
MQSRHRFVLLGLATLLLIPLMLKGRTVPVSRNSTALLRSGGGTVHVRFAGDVHHAGVYTFRQGMSRLTAINLTMPHLLLSSEQQLLLAGTLADGEIIECNGNALQHPVITVKSMKVRERILLGIRLDPNRMSADDWDALPSIGPALAHRIVDYRQINGDYGSLEELKAVSGIGDGKIEKIKKYF